LPTEEYNDSYRFVIEKEAIPIVDLIQTRILIAIFKIKKGN
jgi:hypothetical protein